MNEINDLKELSKYIDGINKNINEIDIEIKKKKTKTFSLENKKINENETKEKYEDINSPIFGKTKYNEIYSNNENIDNNSTIKEKIHSIKSSSISPEIIREVKDIIDKTSQDILSKKLLWNSETNKINDNLRHSFPYFGVSEKNPNKSKKIIIENPIIANKNIQINKLPIKSGKKKVARNLKKSIGLSNYISSVNQKVNKTTVNPNYKIDQKYVNIRKLKLQNIYNSINNNSISNASKRTKRTNNSFTLNKTMPFIMRDKNKINLKSINNNSNIFIGNTISYNRKNYHKNSIPKQRVVKENFNKISEFKYSKKENIANICSIVEQINNLSNPKYIYQKNNSERKKIYVNRTNETKNASFIQKKWREYYIKKNIIDKFKIDKCKNEMSDVDFLQLSKLFLYSDLLKNNKYFKEMILNMNKVTELYKKCLSSKKFNDVKNILLNKNPNEKGIYSKIINIHLKEIKKNTTTSHRK